MADFRVIPSIDALRHRDAIRQLEATFGVEATTEALRAAAGTVRGDVAAGSTSTAVEATARIEALAAASLAARFRGSLRPVINATGVIIHTNLGRAPLAPAALARIAEVGRGYGNLEYDLAAGARGSRTVHAEDLLTTFTGAEAAIVVNNNAAAVMLALAGLAAGREVIISRGELVEIGGGFRVPDVMRQSGAVLREVGTTNRTRAADYTAAVTDRTALLLRVHPSNFRVEGFTERPALEALVTAARAAGVPLVEDLGSGCLAPDLADEPAVQASIASGVDVVCFSGDKLLGGPQAGILAGRRALIDRLRKHPLMRALRVDKLTLAALEATLIEYAAGRARNSVPVQRMLRLGPDDIRPRAERLRAALTAAGWHASLREGASAVGGGSAPGVPLPTVLVTLSRDRQSAAAIEAWLRGLDPPVVARIDADTVVLDLRTVLDDDELTRVLTGPV